MMNYFWKKKDSLTSEHPLVECPIREHSPEEIEELEWETNSQESGLFTIINQWSHKHSLYLGLLLSSLSSFFFSLCSVIVKYVKDVNPGELAMFRFIGILVFTLPMLIYSGESPFGPSELRPMLLLRGLMGSTSLFLKFYAFRYLSIADASVIIFSVPIFVSVFARIFLKEPCGFVTLVTIVLTMVGVAFITKLPILFGAPSGTNSFQNSSYTWGVISALLSTLFGAAVYIVIRKVKCLHHSVIMFNFGWVAVIETTILTAFIGGFSIPQCGSEPWLIIALGLFSFLGQVCLTKALQLEQAGPVSVVRAAVDIVLVFIWQITIFKDIPDSFSIAGAVLVTSCIVLTGIRKWLSNLPEHSAWRRQLYFLLL